MLFLIKYAVQNIEHVNKLIIHDFVESIKRDRVYNTLSAVDDDDDDNGIVHCTHFKMKSHKQHVQKLLHYN